LVQPKQQLLTGSLNNMFAQEGFISRLGWRFPTSAILFLAIPLLWVISVTQLKKANGPQWMPDSFENSYNYLFNSLLLVKGQSPRAFQHPGTTTQVFGAFILRTSSTESADNLIISTLQDPEKQIRKLHWALLIFSALCLWVAPWITAIALRSYLIGLLIQAPSLFYQTLLWYGIMFGPDLMLVPFSVLAICCCSLLAFPSLRHRPEILSIAEGESRISNYNSTSTVQIPGLAILAGVVCALGFVTKLTFFPFILISLLCCRSRRDLVSFLVAFVLGVVVALLPIYPQLSQLMAWTFNLGIHSGEYGTGPVGLPPAGEYLQDVLGLLETEPLIAIIPIVTTTLIVILSERAPRQLRPHRSIVRRIVLPLVGLQLLSFFAIAKHPDAHYLIPLYLSSGLNLVALFYVLRTTMASPPLRIAGWVALIGLSLLGLGSFVELTPRNYDQQRRQAVDRLRLYKEAKALTKNDVLVEYFRSDSPAGALCYGDDFAGKTFGSLLARIYPSALFFNSYTRTFETYIEYIDPKVELQKYDHLYFLGAPSYLPKLDGLDPQTFETIDRADDFFLQKWKRK
jgi:hypothetical protein